MENMQLPKLCCSDKALPQNIPVKKEEMILISLPYCEEETKADWNSLLKSTNGIFKNTNEIYTGLHFHMGQ